MNDFDPSLDEIVSAYVDGVATPDERARVESDPALVERAATFRRLHDAVAAPPARADDDLRTTLIARALAQSAEPVATVHTLRRRRSRAIGPIAAAAAVIALFFGLGTLVASQDTGDSDQSTAASPQRDAFDSKSQFGSPTTTVAGAAGGAPGTLSAAGAPTDEAAKSPSTYLGGFADESALRQALVVAGNSSQSAATTSSAGRATFADASCPRTDAPGVSIYTAELRGRPVTIVVNGTRAEVVDNATCQVTPMDVANR